MLSYIDDLGPYERYSYSLVILMETHTSGTTTKHISKHIGLNGSFIHDAININIIDSSSQLFHMKVPWRDKPHWLLTVVYGSPHYAHHQELQRGLRELLCEINGPWAVVRDLNTIVRDEEMVGLPIQNTKQLEQGLINAFKRCELIDAGYSSDPFIWDVGSFAVCLSHSIQQRVLCFPMPSIQRNEDNFVWGQAHDGVFSTKSAYTSLCSLSQHSNKELFKLVWKW